MTGQRRSQRQRKEVDRYEDSRGGREDVPEIVNRSRSEQAETGVGISGIDEGSDQQEENTMKKEAVVTS